MPRQQDSTDGYSHRLSIGVGALSARRPECLILKGGLANNCHSVVLWYLNCIVRSESFRCRHAADAGRLSSGMYAMSSKSSEEIDRLRALRALDVLDSEADDEFTGLVEAAALACGIPTALITLVDEDRQWFKAGTGLAQGCRRSAWLAFPRRH